jgi:hypothetical protein
MRKPTKVHLVSYHPASEFVLTCVRLFFPQSLQANNFAQWLSATMSAARAAILAASKCSAGCRSDLADDDIEFAAAKADEDSHQGVSKRPVTTSKSSSFHYLPPYQTNQVRSPVFESQVSVQRSASAMTVSCRTR